MVRKAGFTVRKRAPEGPLLPTPPFCCHELMTMLYSGHADAHDGDKTTRVHSAVFECKKCGTQAARPYMWTNVTQPQT